MHCELISVQQNSHPAGIAVRQEAWAFPAWTPQTTALRYLYPSPPSLTLRHTLSLHSPLMTVIPHMSFCPSSLYSAFHRVCPFLMAMWQSVPQSFSRSLFSSSPKYIGHVIKELSLFTQVYSLSPSSLTLTSSLSLSPSLSFRTLLPFLLRQGQTSASTGRQTSCCGPHAPCPSPHEGAKTLSPSIPLSYIHPPPARLFSSRLITLCNFASQVFLRTFGYFYRKTRQKYWLRVIFFAEQRVQRPWAVWFWRVPFTRIQVLLGNRLSLYSFQPLLHSDTFSC